MKSIEILRKELLDEGYGQNEFYMKNTKAVCQYLEKNYSEKKFIIFGTGGHSFEFVDGLKSLSVNAILRPDNLESTFIEKEFTQKIITSVELETVEFDYVLLLGFWTQEAIEGFQLEYKLMQQQVLPIYNQIHLPQYIKKEFINRIGKTDKKVLLHIVWDSKNDMFSESAYLYKEQYYLIKIYMNAFFFSHELDKEFDLILDQSIFAYNQSIAHRTNSLQSLIKEIVPHTIVCMKPTPMVTMSTCYILMNKPPETKFIFLAAGDMLLYKVTNFTNSEFAYILNKDVSDVELMTKSEEYLLKHSDGIISSYGGEYYSEVLKKEAKKSIFINFFMKKESFQILDKDNSSLSQDIKVCFAGSLDSTTADTNPKDFYKAFMTPTREFKALLKQDFTVDIYTFSSCGHECYSIMKKEETKFDIYFNTEHSRLPSVLNKYDFGLVLYHMTEPIIDKMSPILNSCFLSKIITYVSAGIPIICNKEYSFIANIIEEEGIGITFRYDEIHDLRTKIEDASYSKLLKNVQKYREKYFNEQRDIAMANFIQES